MATMSPTGLFPSFEAMAANSRLIEGLMFDLGNEPDEYLAGKILAPVEFPAQEKQNEMNIDGRALHGKIARMAMWGAYGQARPSKIAFGQRLVPVVGQEFDPLDYEGTKYGNTYSIPVETIAEIEEWGVDAFEEMLEIPRTQVLVSREADWAALFGTVSNWATTYAATTPWDAASGSTPIQDIQHVRNLVSKYGKPDTMILGVEAANTLLANEAFNGPRQVTIDRATLTEDQLVEILKARFGFENIYIGSAKTETSADPSNPDPQFIWGSTVWIGRLGEAMRATSTGRVRARRSAVASIVAQPLYADVIGPRINGENDDQYVARVRMIESLNIVQNVLGATITGVVTP